MLSFLYVTLFCINLLFATEGSSETFSYGGWLDYSYDILTNKLKRRQAKRFTLFTLSVFILEQWKKAKLNGKECESNLENGL